jgi:hypothetical protein
MDPKGKGMVVNDNEKESIFNEPRDDKVNDSGSSQKKKDGKKKRRIRKVVYYDSDNLRLLKRTTNTRTKENG